MLEGPGAVNRELPARLNQMCRGEAPDEIFLVDTTGAVLILHAHGVHDDEKLRVRERALHLLSEALAR